jgi:Holliday junction resolvasome RuvABC DNA-binding subunit
MPQMIDLFNNSLTQLSNLSLYKSMTTSNPYVDTLIEMGYDKQDVQVASTMFQKKTFPCVIHGRQFDTEEQYNEELHEFLNGM